MTVVDAVAQCLARWPATRKTIKLAGGNALLELGKASAPERAQINRLRTQLSRELVFGANSHAVGQACRIELAPPSQSANPDGLSVRVQREPAHVECVGWLGLRQCRVHPGQLELGELCIDARCRGLGFGTLALELCFAHCDDEGLAVNVAVNHLNPAKMLYLRLGFEETGYSGPFAQMHRPAGGYAAASQT